MKKIPLKNYVILFIAVGITVFLTYYCCNLFVKHSNHSYNTIMLPFLMEVKEEDMENIVLEKSPLIVYVSNKRDDSVASIEKKLKNFLVDRNIQQYFVYLDVSPEANGRLETFEEQYHVTLDFDQLPIMVAIVDGKVTEQYTLTEWNKTKVSEFLERNEVIEND